MKWQTIAGLISIYLIYLLIGAGIFYSLEYSLEEEKCQASIAELIHYNLTNARDGNTTVKEIIQLVLAATRNGVRFNSSHQASCAHNWNYQNSFFFAGTVLTTIGYGNISPRTTGGQIFCLFYAMIGFPLFAIMLGEIGVKFAGIFKKLDRRLKKKGHKTTRRKCLVLLSTVATLFIFCLIIPSAIFSAVEKWTFHEAFYYSFITLSTIGFGDYVVGTNPDISYISVYRVAVYFWILFGLAFMAIVISLTSELIKEQANKETTKPGNSSEENVKQQKVEEEEVVILEETNSKSLQLETTT